MNAIETSGLTKYYDKLCAVNHLTLSVDNEIFALLGPNGSGKTTTVMKVLSTKETRPFSQIAASMANRTGWDTIPAVQQNRIYLFGGAIEYGPKSFIGLLYTAKILHPALFTDVDPGRLLDDYAAEYVLGTDNTEKVYPMSI